MKIIRIFDPYLYSVKYENEPKDEFSKLFSMWKDPFELFGFFTEHENDLRKAFWGPISVDQAVLHTIDEAEKFEKHFIDLSEQSSVKQNMGLETIFAQLDNMQQECRDLDKRKAKCGWLRIYGLRAEKNVYIVTGGAIKLTKKMEERQHTKKELQKIDMCRSFLLAQGLTDIDVIVAESEI